MFSQLLLRTTLTLLPHLNRLHRHPACISLSPRRQPLVRCVPERPLRIRGRIYPRLVTNLVPVLQSVPCRCVAHARNKEGDLQKPPLLGTDGDIENQVKLLVEGRIASRRSGIYPWVGQQRLIFGHFVETSKVVERLVLLKADKEYLVDPAIYVEINIILSPLDAEGVKAVRVVATADLLGASCAIIGIGTRSWACRRSISLAINAVILLYLPQ